MIQFTFKFEQVMGTNNGYIINRGFRTKSAKSNKFQSIIEKTVARNKNYFARYDPKNEYFKIELFWYNPKFYKKNNKTMSKVAGDIDGPIKFILDGVFKGIGIDDYACKSLNILQLPSNDKYHVLAINVTTEKLSNLRLSHEALP